MFHMRELVDANRKEIASLISREHGKVLGDALGEVARGLENIEFACGIPNLLKGGYSEQASTGIDVYSIKQPLGVVAGITPFNFPGMVPMWMFANALACGNTFILKPSEKDPSASMFIGDLLKQAGLPDGCFNVVNGDKVAVDRILEHPDIAAVSFVGSTPIAKYIYETGTKNGKRVQALGGAKNHMLVLPDADLDMAADAAVSAAYGSAGERCMAISRRAGQRVDRRRAGRQDQGSHPGDQGRPGQRIRERDGPADHRRTPRQGCRLRRRGRRRRCDRWSSTAEQGAPGEGFFLMPSLIDNAKPGMACYDDEIFGPVLTVTRISGYQEGLQADQRQPVWKWHCDLHPRRWCGPAVRVRRPGRDGRCQRAGSRTGQLLQLRRVEGQLVRRHPHVRSGRCQLLHQDQGRDLPLARPQHQHRRPRIPPESVSSDLSSLTASPPLGVRHRHRPASAPLGVRPSTRSGETHP